MFGIRSFRKREIVQAIQECRFSLDLSIYLRGRRLHHSVSTIDTDDEVQQRRIDTRFAKGYRGVQLGFGFALRTPRHASLKGTFSPAAKVDSNRESGSGVP